jgi:RNase adaptor protein for sRNA GlmZ degradation
MPPERAAHAILFLTGEVHALIMFSQALAKSHPDSAALLLRLNEAAQYGLASLEQLPNAGDVVIDGYQFAIDAIRKAAKAV